MVNFSKPEHLTQPVGNIAKILILEKKDNVVLAYEELLAKEWAGKDSKTLKAYLSSRLYILYKEVEAMLKRHKKNDCEEWELIQKLFRNKGGVSMENIDRIITFLFEFLDFIKLTRIDTKAGIDTTRTALEDLEAELG